MFCWVFNNTVNRKNVAKSNRQKQRLIISSSRKTAEAYHAAGPPQLATNIRQMLADKQNLKCFLLLWKCKAIFWMPHILVVNTAGNSQKQTLVPNAWLRKLRDSSSLWGRPGTGTTPHTWAMCLLGPPSPPVSLCSIFSILKQDISDFIFATCYFPWNSI